jgi:hypothetical protein
MFTAIIVVGAFVFAMFVWARFITASVKAHFSVPREVLELLESEPLKRYPYTDKHLRKVRVDQRPPRYFVGNDKVKVAYWRTAREDGVKVETIALFHSWRKVDIRATFLNGKFEVWSFEGHRLSNDYPTTLEDLEKILKLVSEFAP